MAAPTKALLDAYREAELRLLNKLKNSLSEWAVKDLGRVQAFLKSAKQEVTPLKTRLDKELQESYDEGVAIGERNAAALKLPRGKIDPFARDAKLKLLTDDLEDALKTTHVNILRSVRDVYREVVGGEAAQMVAGSTDRRTAVQNILNKFADRGVQAFIDKAGRKWDWETYVNMAVGQAQRNASVAGTTDKYEQLGIDLVQIPDSEEPCPICIEWENRVVSLRGETKGYPTLAEAEAEGFLHIGCQHTEFTIYIPGISDKPTPLTKKGREQAAAEYAERQKQRYLERNMRRWQRREAVAMDPAEKRFAAAKSKEWEAAMKDFAKTTGRERDRERETVRL